MIKQEKGRCPQADVGGSWERAVDKNMTALEIKRSSRKTLTLEITGDGRLIARAPYRMPEQQIVGFVEEKADWIRSNMEKMRRRVREAQQEAPLSREEMSQLAQEAARLIPERAAWYAGKLGVEYGRIAIRCQKTRWGSCSGKGNLNFNCLLMLAPREVLDYVVVHELCHRLEMNHSPRFWSLVEGMMPDYRERRQWLKENGGRLMSRFFREERKLE